MGMSGPRISQKQIKSVSSRRGAQLLRALLLTSDVVIAADLIKMISGRVPPTSATIQFITAGNATETFN